MSPAHKSLSAETAGAERSGRSGPRREHRPGAARRFPARTEDLLGVFAGESPLAPKTHLHLDRHAKGGAGGEGPARGGQMMAHQSENVRARRGVSFGGRDPGAPPNESGILEVSESPGKTALGPGPLDPRSPCPPRRHPASHSFCFTGVASKGAGKEGLTLCCHSNLSVQVSRWCFQRLAPGMRFRASLSGYTTRSEERHRRPTSGSCRRPARLPGGRWVPGAHPRAGKGIPRAGPEPGGPGAEGAEGAGCARA